MDVRRRPSKPVVAADSPDAKSKHSPSPLKYYVDEDPSLKVPPTLYFVNASVIFLFFTVLYYLLSRWREKICSSSPLHILSALEVAALLAFATSSVYLLGFFGVKLFQSLLLRPPSNLWADDCEEERVVSVIADGGARKAPYGQALDCETPKLDFDPVKPAAPKAKPVETEKWDEPIGLTEEDEEVIASVVAGTTPLYSLESKLRDCRKAAAVCCEALQRTTGKSLAVLPLEAFDYESILEQCCEMPVGYLQIPMGIVGPLALDEREYSVPMATTEGCLVASTNQGCKVIAISGGASSIVLRDGMTRAPVVRFGSAKRAAELKFYLESPANFEALSSVFNRLVSVLISLG